MATRKVRFDFQCDRTLTYQHEVPASLVGPNAGSVPGYRDEYVKAVLPVMRAHTDECIAASNATCAVYHPHRIWLRVYCILLQFCVASQPRVLNWWQPESIHVYVAVYA
ncbi:hypothetical protein G7054_g4726 [Neopestalotiopsis clavispora]|nr:hypothetical protein G7054_g4726 [Neopestalotiopsis clavispora]